MPLSDTALNAMATELASIATHMQPHSGDPGAAGALNPVANVARVAVAWDAAANGDISLTGTELFTGAAAGATITWISLWTGAGTGTTPTGGTFVGRFQLTGDTTFNASGEYTVTDVTINGSST